MRRIDFNQIEAREDGTYNAPSPGGYIARIERVKDNEQKEYLVIEWDFAEGPFAGYNAETEERAGFWPTRLFRSYKEKALPFFKGFLTAVERSNRRFVFDCARPACLEGKLVGIVLGEEEYRKRNGKTGTRLYVARTCSIDTIEDGKYTVPECKRLQADTQAASAPALAELDGDDGELPF